MSKRQQADFHKPHLIPELLLAPLHVKKPSTILVNFMGDLMGDWVDPNKIVSIEDHRFEGQYYPPGPLVAEGFGVLGTATLKETLFHVMEKCPEHRFLFLTKSPENYAKWGHWPDNAWLGASVCNDKMFLDALYHLSNIRAKNKWLSIEPLLSFINIVDPGVHRYSKELLEVGISWVVIGSQSQPTIHPDIAWVQEIVEACDRSGIKVWLKWNFAPMFPGGYLPAWTTERGVFRQELP